MRKRQLVCRALSTSQHANIPSLKVLLCPISEWCLYAGSSRVHDSIQPIACSTDRQKLDLEKEANVCHSVLSRCDRQSTEQEGTADSGQDHKETRRSLLCKGVQILLLTNIVIRTF